MDKSSSVERFKLRKELELLEGKKGRGTELVSLYIPPDKNLNDVMSQMRDEYSQAANIKSKRTKKNVQSALEVIQQRLKLINRVPVNGLVMLVGTIPKGTADKTEIYLIEPPEPITTYIYRCDSEFLLEPIKDMLEEKKCYGLLVVDRREATIGLLKRKNIEITKKLTSGVPGKHGRGGQSQRRFERLIENAAHEFMKRIGGHASDIFLSTPNLEGIIVGGPGPTKDYFVKQEYLSKEVQKRILGVLDTSYTDDFGIKELVNNASEIFKDLDIIKEKKLMQRFLEEVVKDKGLASYGEDEVKRFLQIGAVDTVLISEDFESYKTLVKCSRCGHEENKTVKDLMALENSLTRRACEKCGEKSLYVHEFKSLLDDLSEIAETTNAKIEIISSETEEGQQLKAFGGIAAILRYRPS